MKKRLLRIIILIVIILFLIVVIIERKFVQKTSDFMFYLEEKYYGNSVFNEINSYELNDLINDKESFVIFIHQPFCSVSYEFNKLLTKFAEENKVSFYKVNFDEIKKTIMYDNIKYYPSFAIYNNGKLIDFLKADSDNDLNRYKNSEDFKNWFNSYIKMKNITK